MSRKFAKFVPYVGWPYQMSFLQKVSQTGWLYSFANVFNRVVPKWLFRCRRFTIYELDLESFDTSTHAGLELSWCTSPAEIEAAVALSYFDPSTSRGENSACQAVLDDQMVGAFWTTGNFFNEQDLGVQIALSPKQQWLFSAYVDRNFRNRGIYSSLLRFLLQELQQRGFESPLVAVNPDNLGSNYIHAKHAVKSPGTVLAIRFLTIAVCFGSGKAQPDRWLTMTCRKNPIRVRVETSS